MNRIGVESTRQQRQREAGWEVTIGSSTSLYIISTFKQKQPKLVADRPNFPDCQPSGIKSWTNPWGPLWSSASSFQPRDTAKAHFTLREQFWCGGPARIKSAPSTSHGGSRDAWPPKVRVGLRPTPEKLSHRKALQTKPGNSNSHHYIIINYMKFIRIHEGSSVKSHQHPNWKSHAQ